MKAIQHRKIAVIGGGSWATALVKTISDNGTELNWWIREPEIIENIQLHARNSYYLSSVDLYTKNICVSNDLEAVVQNSEIILFCIPSAFLKLSLTSLAKSSLKDKIIVSAIKGIIPDQNSIICDFFNKEYNVGYQNFVVVSGPSHAEEVAQEKLTYLTVASQNKEIAGKVANIIECHYIKTSLSDDIFGTEYSAVLKNIFAVATGISIGLGYGDNYRAVLISNALQETKRFIDCVHPINRELSNSVYLGDLLVTAYSQYSRNRTFGTMLGAGYSVKSAQLEMKMIAEGYYTTKCIYEINKTYKVDMPIVDAVYKIIYGGIAPKEAFKTLENKLT